jgi:hypothetical protein
VTAVDRPEVRDEHQQAAAEIVHGMSHPTFDSQKAAIASALAAAEARGEQRLAVDRPGSGQSAPLLPCCDHCGCSADDRTGHDDTCAVGCNDPQPSLARVLAEVAAEVKRQDAAGEECIAIVTRGFMVRRAARSIRSVLAFDAAGGGS